jgi:hypothetical protein
VLELCVQGYILLFTCLAKVKIRHARFATEQVRKTVWTEFKILDGSVRRFFCKTVSDPSDGFPHTPIEDILPVTDLYKTFICDRMHTTRGLSRSVTCGGGAPPHGSRRRRRAAPLISAAAASASEFFRWRRRGAAFRLT